MCRLSRLGGCERFDNSLGCLMVSQVPGIWLNPSPIEVLLFNYGCFHGETEAW